MDDATLVCRCLREEPGAIEALIDRFHGEVFGLCVRLLGHRHDAEDVTQEVFLVHRSLRTWDPARPLRPWVMGIAVNRCRTWMARRARRPETADYLQETPARCGDDGSPEALREIRRALDGLRPDFRLVFVLFHEHGHSYEEIADALARPVGTVKTWLHRARAEILEQLRRRGMVEDAPTPPPRPARNASP